MTFGQSLLAFSLAAALLTITPGPDTALVLRTAVAECARRAILVGFGIATGCLTWGIALALGLGALIATSEVAYQVLKTAGAVYLAWLGLTLMLSPQRAWEAERPPDPAGSGVASFRRGFLTNVLNPKVGIFYVSFLPQFIPNGASVPATTILLTGLHAALGLIWFLVLIRAADPLIRVLKLPAVALWIDRFVGAVFVGLGVRLAIVGRT